MLFHPQSFHPSLPCAHFFSPLSVSLPHSHTCAHRMQILTFGHITRMMANVDPERSKCLDEADRAAFVAELGDRGALQGFRKVYSQVCRAQNVCKYGGGARPLSGCSSVNLGVRSL
jgi:hypothetical protein